VHDFEKLGVFYLGRVRDLATNSTRAEPLLCDSRKLLTHALCMGMTGSGKTGLCLSLLEEAALDGIPTLAIDPKGDLGNLLLTFPELRGEDFAPWVDPAEATQKGLSCAEHAAQVAESWRAGLAAWGQDGARIQKLRAAADLSVYTPGSSAGIPLSVLRSLSAPSPALREDTELLRSHIAGTVQGLLGLIGIQADPVQSREHILLATLIEQAFQAGQDLDLAALLAGIQTPPFTKLGVLELETFYPAKERAQLALALNALLASPSFASWLTGEPLDIQQLLYTPEGKPRIAIISIAHLSDAERMFFVTLLLNQVLAWMRAQSGTSSLRALLYMDEVFGYFPPVAEPPAKRPLLTLLKQARAFGLGVVLATQNPVDLDYKGLSNIGTWFIGRLQTERDQARVLDGLASASGAAGFDRAEQAARLAGLSKRVFLLHDVSAQAPIAFETRWSMSYLRGPMTRAEIKTLMDARRASAAKAPVVAPTTAASATARPTTHTSTARPAVPPEVPQFFVPHAAAPSATPGLAYQAELLGIARVSYSDAKLGVEHNEEVALRVPILDQAVAVDFQTACPLGVAHATLTREPSPGLSFLPLASAALAPKRYAAWSKELHAHLAATARLTLWRSKRLGLSSAPGESERDFRVRLQLAAREQRDLALTELRNKYATKLDTLEERVQKAEATLAREQNQAQSAQIDGALSVGASLLGALFGNKPLSVRNVNSAKSAARSLGKAGKERDERERAEAGLAQAIEKRDALQAELNAALTQLEQSLAEEPLEPLLIKAKKSSIQLQLVGLVYVPVA
jgi:hypothetical protein